MSRPALAGARVALGTLTVVPVGDVGEVTRPVARWAMVLAPLGALPVAVAAAVLVWMGSALGLSPLLVGVGCVGVIALVTRALHLDGLADTVDGLGSGRPAAGALEIMRRGDVGPMGVVALVLVLAAQALGVAGLAAHRLGPFVVAAAVLASRSACTLLTSTAVPPARTDGLGAGMAATVPTPLAALVALVSGGLLAGVAAAELFPLWQALLAGLVQVPVCVWLARTATRRLGGVTGDVIGAGVELSLCAALVVLSVRVAA